ncbi:MAG TPA: 30S ribosomal protein S20 [Dehalococcoidia bacterium]|nr:30S ribosomal protein S20 [Dehalococcoidia bacterium]
MSASKSTRKAARTQERRRLYNRSIRRRTRTMLRAARESTASGDVERAQNATRVAISALDRAVSKGVLHKNTAARLKSRLARRTRGLIAHAADS